jgi:hypothetical protein
MDTCSVKSRWFARIPTAGAARRGRDFALLSLGLALLPLPATSSEKPVDKLDEAWPVAVQARYRLRYNSIEVGRLNVTSNTTAKTYSISGSGKVSVLFGAFTWSGASSVSGTIEGGTPAPATYAFEWHHNKGKKNVAIHIGYEGRVAVEVAVNPPPRIRPDTVPLTQAHKTGALDPLSAIMMLTKADNRPPCDRRASIFDGTQRYDIVFTPKRQTRLPPPSGGGASEIAHVCRITYEPVAGHRANADTKAYASNSDVEVVLRRIPGSEMLIPYSVTIPTAWGTGSMVVERIDIVTTAGKFAFTE